MKLTEKNIYKNLKEKKKKKKKKKKKNTMKYCTIAA